MLTRTLAWLARGAVPGRPRRVLFSFLALGALVTVLVGMWGWSRLSDDLDLGYDFWTQAYRTLSLFFGEGGGIDPVNWQLDVARLIGLTVSLVAGATGVLGLFARRLQSSAARRATNHLLLVGEHARLDRLIEEWDIPQSGRTVVHVCPTGPGIGDTDLGSRGRLRTMVGQIADDWAEAGNAGAAASIVVAADQSDTSIAIAMSAVLLPERSESSDRSVYVDVDDLGTANWFNVWALIRGPGVEVNAVDIDGFRLDRSLSKLFDRGAVRSRDAVIVVGRGSRLERAATTCRELADHRELENVVVFRVGLDEQADTPQPLDQIDAVVGACSDRRVVTVAVDPDDAGVATASMELDVRLADSNHEELPRTDRAGRGVGELVGPTPFLDRLNQQLTHHLSGQVALSRSQAGAMLRELIDASDGVEIAQSLPAASPPPRQLAETIAEAIRDAGIDDQLLLEGRGPGLSVLALRSLGIELQLRTEQSDPGEG